MNHCGELWVVTAVAAIGFSMLVSASGAVRGSAAQTQCAENMRQLTRAAHQYAAAHDGTLPAAGKSAASTEQHWAMELAPYAVAQSLEPGWRPDAYPVYHCPADLNEASRFLIDNNHIGRLSYCVNLALMDFTGGDANADGVRGGRKPADVAHPAERILLAENHAPDNSIRFGGMSSAKCWNRGFSYEYSVQNGDLETDDAKCGYHDYRNNYAMLDGSLRLELWEDTIKPKLWW